MIAETLSVGTELLLGQIVDTDAVFLAQMLSRLGVTLYVRTTVGDNPERIKDALRLALSRADRGHHRRWPGADDGRPDQRNGRRGAGRALVEDAAHAEWLRGFGRDRGLTDVPESFQKQALVPQSGRGLPNPNGTALGALFEKDGKVVICLPGPPNELIPMVEQSVEPYLRESTSGERQVIRSRTLRIIGAGESLRRRPGPRPDARRQPHRRPLRQDRRGPPARHRPRRLRRRGATD